MMFSTHDGSLMWSINQISEPKLSVTTEKSEAKDALGSTIATFDRGKNAEFSAENSLFDLSLLAAQNGVTKNVASETKTITCPTYEEITVPKTGAVALKYAPVTAPKYIYKLNGDGTLGEMLALGTAVAEGKFAYNEESHAISFHSTATVGALYAVFYDREAKAAVSVDIDAINFPKAGRFVMEVLGSDVCDPTTLVHAYVEFPNAKLDANVDITFTTEGKHPFKVIVTKLLKIA